MSETSLNRPLRPGFVGGGPDPALAALTSKGGYHEWHLLSAKPMK
jgi:hypothetical protein